MKIPIVLSGIALLLICVVVGSAIYIASLYDIETPSPSPSAQLVMSHLFASSNGTVTFDLSLYDVESGIVEAVFVNDTEYLWSAGSSESEIILKGESMRWSKDLGSLSPGAQIEVIVQATPTSTSDSVIVDQSPTSQTDFPDYHCDFYGGVNLFDQGIYITSTTENPLIQMPYSHLSQDIWTLIRQNITTQATDEDFISIIISRGDEPTGGFGIAIESFSYLECYPVKLRFHVNVTDPGDNVIVTQALTNPLVLVPLGKLMPGEYQLEVHIASYIQNNDEQGNIIWIPIMTFKEEVWTKNFTVTDSQGYVTLSTFSVIINGNPYSNLTLAVDLNEPINEEIAKKIADAVFVHVKGENTHFQLDRIVYNSEEIIASFIWGLNEADMSHIFELTVDIINSQIEVVHCL